MQEQDKPKPTLAAEANDAFELDLTAPAPANIAVVGNDNVPATNAAAGELTYANATPEEKVIMDGIMAKIDLLDSESIIALGKEQRQKLGELSDQILDSIKPEMTLAFANAMKDLMNIIGSNSVAEMKKRVEKATSSLADVFGRLNPFGDSDEEKAKKKAEKLINAFMTDISSSRKVIQEMVDKLDTQAGNLNANFGNINKMGGQLVITAQEMRIVRAAAAEKIRRIETSEDTILIDLAAKAKDTGRPDDMEKLNDAQTHWNLLRKADAGLLGSVNVYEMNIANLAFTKQANKQNRLDTEVALSNTVNEWKGGLAIFAMVTTETAAQTLLNNVDKITEKSVKANQDLFDTLVDMTVGRSAKGPYNLRQLVDAQQHMMAKLGTVSEQVEANFKALADDKKALEESSKKFKASMVDTFSKNGGNILATPTRQGAAPQP